MFLQLEDAAGIEPARANPRKPADVLEQAQPAQHCECRRFTGITAMRNLNPQKLVMVIALMCPLAAYAQSSGGGSSGGGTGGGSAGGAASGPSAGSGSAVGSPNAGSAGAGTAGVSGVPSGPANVGGLNNSGNDPSGAGNAAKVPNPPGTNAAGTANSSGGASATTGSAGNRAVAVRRCEQETAWRFRLPRSTLSNRKVPIRRNFP